MKSLCMKVDEGCQRGPAKVLSQKIIFFGCYGHFKNFENLEILEIFGTFQSSFDEL